MVSQNEFDLSDGYNRIAGCWYPVFGAASRSIMPIAACAYPINMGEHMIAVIRDEVSPEDHHLRWQMTLPTARPPHSGEYHLHCNWQGRSWQYDAETLLFIENAVGWVDPVGLGDDAGLEVHISFGRPEFVDRVATMLVDFRVDFRVDERGGANDATPCVHRPFRIHADGRRDQLF